MSNATNVSKKFVAVAAATIPAETVLALNALTTAAWLTADHSAKLKKAKEDLEAAQAKGLITNAQVKDASATLTAGLLASMGIPADSRSRQKPSKDVVVRYLQDRMAQIAGINPERLAAAQGKDERGRIVNPVKKALQKMATPKAGDEAAVKAADLAPKAAQWADRVKETFSEVLKQHFDSKADADIRAALAKVKGHETIKQTLIAILDSFSKEAE